MPIWVCCCFGFSKLMTNDLIARAKAARERSISPYSNFKVGAALRTREGKIYDGCNIENASFGLTVCAERVALLKALSEGEREFTEIAVVTDNDKLTPPCGPCRQLLWEYCGNIPVRLHSLRQLDEIYDLADLFPRPFDSKNLY
jgi:cytidine deaminase